MARIFMVRHGKAAASFTDDIDPGLDDLGRKQAAAVAERLSPHLPIKIISSPLKRARQTAEPLLSMQDRELIIEERVSEIPSPGLSLAERGPWLREVMSGTWATQSDDLHAWRGELVQYLIKQPDDCIIFSHFVAINVVAAFAEGRDEMTIFRPDNTSVTKLQTDGENLRLLERGEEAVTVVN